MKYQFDDIDVISKFLIQKKEIIDQTMASLKRLKRKGGRVVSNRRNKKNFKAPDFKKLINKIKNRLEKEGLEVSDV